MNMTLAFGELNINQLNKFYIMKTKTKNLIFLSFILIVFTFFLFAFGNASLNIKEWDGTSRAICALSFAFCISVSFVIVYLESWD